MSVELAPIRVALTARMDEFARNICGEPNKYMSTHRELRFGRRGSLAVATAGPKAGSWCDHETGEGGGPLDLIMVARECSFRNALEIAQDFLGAAQPDAGHKPPEIVLRATDDSEVERIARAMSYWARSIDPRGTLVEAYLKSRCIALPEVVVGEAIRFCPGPRSMVALMRDIHTNEPCGIHRTFLNADGTKIEKKMLGRARGAAIKLSPDEDVARGLHIGEGIESTLSFMVAGYAPAWALGSSGAIASFPVLPEIEALTIFTENDNASDRAAAACTDRWLAADREVTIATPHHGDGNDILKEVAA